MNLEDIKTLRSKSKRMYELGNQLIDECQTDYNIAKEEHSKMVTYQKKLDNIISIINKNEEE